MISKYHETLARLHIPPSKTLSAIGNLLVADTPSPTDPVLADEQLRDFDVVACCLAVHHMEDVELSVRKLAERVRPGGVLLVVDFVSGFAHGGSPARHEHNVRAHQGFTEEEMRRLFGLAGCTDFGCVYGLWLG